MENEELFDVAITGISGKFPSSEDIEELKNNLLQTKNLVTDENIRWNKENWNIPLSIGKISVVNKFDDTFFGIHSKVAAMMDPLTRVTIERAYEAIIDAGINPKHLKESHTAVYTASCISDSEAMGCDEKLIEKFWLLAHVRALLANRISYLLNLQGPSWTIDSGWTGGIECLKHATNDIRRGRVHSALVGVTSVILSPNMSQHWLGLGKLSPDGSTSSFEDTANGYGRSESVVLLYLQRANEAKRIYATIEHVDVTFCGDEAHNLLKPKEEAFESFLQKFYADCKVPTREIEYIEADGSADKYLDELELSVIKKVFCENRKTILQVGAVKSNLGHSEGAACFVSLAKTLISLNSEIIPPNLNDEKLRRRNKQLKKDNIQFVTNPTVFPNGKYAAINTIGWSSHVGHILLKQNQKLKKQILDTANQMPRLVLLSARNEKGILNMIDKVESLPYDIEYFSMINNVFMESITGHFYRGFTILGSTQKRMHFTLEVGTCQKRPIWYIFAGMGSQWPGMGADLMKIPIFANTINELHSYLSPLEIDLIDVITNYDPSVLRDIINSFVGITAIQIGLIDILTALGIRPDGMFGHSLGENSCAYADGCLTKYQTIMTAYYRGKSSAVVPVAKGLMVAVGLNYNQLLRSLPENVQIACHNSEENCTISGPYEEVKAFADELKKQNVFVRLVNSNNIAYHSKQVEPLIPFLLENIRKVIPNPKKRSAKWISTSVPKKDWNTPLCITNSAEYQVNNFVNTVYFAEALKHIPEDAVVIEISPHGLFQGILKRTLHESCFNVPLGKRETSSSLNFLLHSIGKLFVIGLQPDVNAIYEPVEYPVSRNTPNLASLVTWNHETEWETNNYDEQLKIKPLQISLREKKWRFLTGYKINENILIPFPLLMIQTIQAYDTTDPFLIFEDVQIKNFVKITPQDIVTILTQVQYGRGNFEIINNKTVIMDGTVRYSKENTIKGIENENESNFCDDYISFSENEIQTVFNQYSIHFSHDINDIKYIIFTDTGCKANIVWKNNYYHLINSLANVKTFYNICKYGKGPLLPRSFLNLTINLKKFNLIKYGTILNVTYDKYTDVISDGSDIKLTNLKLVYEHEDNIENKLQIQNMQFVPYDNPPTDIIEDFLSLCGQIIGENFSIEFNRERQDYTPRIVVLKANDSKDRELKDEIQCLLGTVFKKLPQIQNDTIYVNYDELHTIGSENKYDQYLVFLHNFKIISEKLIKLMNNVENVFVVSNNATLKFPKNYEKIVEKEVEKQYFSLWKKKIEMDSILLEINPYQNNHWLEDLEEDLYQIESRETVTIYWFSEYIVDVIDTLNQISAIGTVHKTRFVIILDKNLSINIDNLLNGNELKKGLMMNVYKNGKWGNIGYLAKTNSMSSVSNIQKFIFKTNKVEDIDINYLSTEIEFSDSQNANEPVNFFEFSGTTSTNSRIMGIAYSAPGNLPEKLITWSVPKQWLLEDAVTIPLAYVKVYYALVIQGKLNKKASVLIHSGHSILGEAAVAISLSFNSKVYTTVDSEEKIKFIQKRFAKFIQYNDQLTIFNTETSKADIEILKLTNGNGVRIVINADTEKEIQESLNLIHEFGIFLQLSKDVMTNVKIGMNMFAKSVSMYSLINVEIIRMQPELKTRIQNAIQTLIDKGIIRPFRRLEKNSEEQNYNINQNNSYKTVINQKVKKNQLFICNSEKSYLIIANKNEMWFNISTWLIQHGARKLVFIENIENTNEFNVHEKKFSIFCENYSDLSVVYLPTSSLDNKYETEKTIKTIYQFASVDVVFCVSLNTDQLSNVDASLQKHAKNLRQFICLQCDASRICESRHHALLPALNIIWNKSISQTTSLHGKINQILNNLLSINSPLLYITDYFKLPTKYGNSDLQQINNIFANYCEVQNFNSYSTYACFEKITSKCTYYCERTQLFPIFIIPGLHHHCLQPLIKKLMYPVFYAKITPKYTSVKTIAQSLLKSLKEIQPNGPYTVVGESWSGPLAIELTSLLEENFDDRVQLILLEAIPSDMKNKLSSIGLFKNNDILSHLQESYLGNTLINKQLMNGDKKTTNQDETKFLEFLRNKLALTYYYKPTYVNIKGKVIAIKAFDDSILDTYIEFEKYYGQDLQLEVLNVESHEQVINSNITARIINDNVLFKW